MSSPLPLDEQYFTWLYQQVADARLKSPSRTYWSLFRLLYKTEFVWLIPNDDNRVADGVSLRHEFLTENRIDVVDRNWMDLICSFLEMLIGLSKRLSELTDVPVEECFWHFIKVLGFDSYSDNRQIPHDHVADVLNTIIWRQYKSNGDGGLFPLKHTPMQDQRDVELWYQLNNWLLEQN